MVDTNTLDKQLHAQKLIYTNTEANGYSRKKQGDQWVYFNTHNEKIKDPRTIKRIESLTIPPAWKKVWISPDDRGHIQSTGVDEKARKQYIYHEKWNIIRQQTKFSKMLFFGDVLPTIREQITAHLKEKGLTENKVLATVVFLLGTTYIRIGNKEYATENQSYGLTTLRSKHTEVIGNTVRFEFRGKSGIDHEVDITHPQIARIIRQLENLPGYELFKYREDGKKHIVTSDDVNAYLQSITGDEITAKDFRTWGGTVLAATTLNNLGEYLHTRDAKKNITTAVKEVSKHLRNTPTVCRSYYIHPYIPDSYQGKELIPHFTEVLKRRDINTKFFDHEEHAVHLLLKKSSKK